MKKRTEEYGQMVERLFPHKIVETAGNSPMHHAVKTVTIQTNDSCPLRCTYCLDGGTKILMADKSEKAIKDVVVGDKILAFKENVDVENGAEFVMATVKRLFRRKAETIKMKFTDNKELIITPNHKILMDNGQFVEAGAFSLSMGVVALCDEFSKFGAYKLTSVEPYGEIDVYNIETTSGTYFANGIAVHNCYQINKGEHIIPIETAKTFIDKLLTNQYAEYIDVNDTDGIILEFIGGEPLVAIDIIDEITNYFIKQMILMNHKWLPRFRLSMISNGVLYFEPKVQEYLRKNAAHLSFGISIDGNKELHDACRVFPDGSGSYDMAMAAVQHFREHFTDKIGSKMTLCPENIMYTYDAVVSLIENGYDEVNLNCVYEEGWTDDDAKIMYQQLKKVADYIFENDLWDKIYLSIFEQSMFHPLSESDNTNYCGGNGAMLAIDWKGDMYPCIRYMESSVGDDVEPMIIGNVYDGIMKTQKQCDCVHCLWSITRRSQSTDECWNCPIAAGCGACTAYNYQHFGDANHRAMYICCTHKARALANSYYWNKGFKLNNEMKRFHLYLPDDDALKIIDKDELAMLKSLET